MKKAEKYGSSSFHGVRISTTPKKLVELAKKLGADYCSDNLGLDKTNFDFEFETEDGRFFTVYDWKHYRRLKMNEVVEFHIGANDEITSVIAAKELANALKDL